MDKTKILIIGIGQAGNNLANQMKMTDGRYTLLFINSSDGDWKNLKYANETNTFLFTGLDGAGNNRDRAKEFIVNDGARIHSVLSKYKQFTHATIFVGTGGGTGSGTVKGITGLLKDAVPKIKINLVCVLPSQKEDAKKIKNSIACLKDLEEIDGIINSMIYINNEKGDSYNEINTKATIDINNSYGLISHDEIGSIDESNLENVCNSKGYGVILNLPTEFTNFDDAIEKAKDSSIFCIPDDLYCEYGAICVDRNVYRVDRLVRKFDCDETIFISYKEKTNMIVLGGCDFPEQIIQDLKDSLKEHELRRPRERKRRLKIQDDDIVNDVSKQEESKNNDIFTQEDYSRFDLSRFKI